MPIFTVPDGAAVDFNLGLFIVPDGDAVDFELTDGVGIRGSGFEASQNTGKVEIGDNSDYGLAILVEQTVIFWSDTLITFTPVQGSFTISGTYYVFVTNDSGNVSDGYPITITIESSGDGGSSGVFSAPSKWLESEETLLAEILTIVSGERHYAISAETSINELRAYYTLPKFGFGRNHIYRSLLIQVTGVDLGSRRSDEFLLATVRDSLG